MKRVVVVGNLAGQGAFTTVAIQTEDGQKPEIITLNTDLSLNTVTGMGLTPHEATMLAALQLTAVARVIIDAACTEVTAEELANWLEERHTAGK